MVKMFCLWDWLSGRHKNLLKYYIENISLGFLFSLKEKGLGVVVKPSKFVFLLTLFAIPFSNLFAQKKYNCLDWKSNVSVNTFLVQKMHEQYDERRKEFARAIKSAALTRQYIKNVRTRIAPLFGNFPQKIALHAISAGTLHRDGYKIEKIIFASFQNHHVTANIYIPNGKGVFPAALLFCGHENEAKATESYQKTAILFAKNGFVVLVVDPISQGERYQLTDSAGKPLTRGGTTAHTLLNEGSSLVGKSTPADELWDNVRALDYLETRPEVDTSKIGCLGNSGGGMQTIYFAGYEKRVKIFAPCSYLANRERTLEISGAADGCAQMPGEGKEHLELSDFLIASAPKPILVLAGRYDFIDYTGTLMAVNDLKKVYTSLHQSEKIKLFTYDDGHGISRPKREAAITWFRKWFYNDSTKIIEGDIVTLPQRDLLCSKTGQVSTDFPNEVSLSERNLKQFDNLKESRKAFLKHDSNFIHKKIAELLGLNLHDKKINVDTTGAVKNNNIIYKKLILRKKDEIPLPVLIINSKGQRPDKIIIWLNEKGKDELADSLSLIQSYLDKNDAVFLCDVSGTGETEDNPEFNDKKFYNREYRNALLALHIGKSMVGLRTADLLTLLSFIKSVTAYKDVPIEINATGFTTISALQAALFSNQIVTLNLYNGIKSYKDILENPIEKNWYSYIVNDCLKYYDLPDLVNLIRKNKVNLSGTTDLLK